MENRYTWYSCDGKTKKILDYVLLQRFINQYVTDCCVKPQFEFISDHRLLITNLKTPKDKKSRWKPKLKPNNKPDIKLLQEKIYKSQYINHCTEGVTNLRNPNSSADEISDNLVQTLSAAASTVLPNKTTKTVNEIWKNDATLNQLIENRTGKAQSSIEYINITKQIKSRVRELRNEKLRNEAQELNSFTTKRDIERMYKSFKDDGSTFKSIRQKDGCDAHKLRKYFSAHFGTPSNDPDPIELVKAPVFLQRLTNVPVDYNTLPPKKDEIIDTLKKLKNRKASNDIPAEFLKYAIDSDEVIEEMYRLYCLVWLTKQIPTKWRHSKLVTIWKGASKGKIDDPAAYRGIQVGSTFCKVLVIMILERTKTWYEEQLLDNQQGFCSSRGTSDAIYIVKRIQQIAHASKKPVCLLFVDLSAAFDHVNRKWLFKSLKQRFPNEESNTLIDLLESLYSYTTTSIGKSETDIFELFVGVRQGGAESPTLYNLYMDYVMRIFMHECNTKRIKFPEFSYMIPHFASKNNDFSLGNYGNRVVSWIGYADDIVLAFENISDLNNGLGILNRIFKRYQLNINASKTKTMIVNYQGQDDEYPDVICNINGSEVNNVKVFKYIGANIHFREFATGDTEINQRIESAECKFYEHAKKLMNYKIALTTRVSILNALI